MAGNFNIEFNSKNTTNIEQYEYSQSNLLHSATTARMDNNTEINYGEAEEFDYESYLLENASAPATQTQPETVYIAVEQIEEIRDELLGYGFSYSDINRLLTGQITVEDLYNEIENDPDGTRRRKIYESSYLSSLNSEFKTMGELAVDLVRTERELNAAKEAQVAFDLTEEEAALGVLKILSMYGGDLDEIVDSYIIGWVYEDLDGITRYEYSYDQNNLGGYYGATPIYYNDVFKDSKYLEQIRELLVEQTRRRGFLIWSEEYTAYEWQNTEEQIAFYEFLYEKTELAIANREQKREEYQTQIDALTTRKLQEEQIQAYITQELDHYMENIDAYIHNPDFLDKCGINSSLVEKAEEINSSTDIEYIYEESLPTKSLFTKEEQIAVIAAIMNKTGDFHCSLGYVFTKNGRTLVLFSNSTLDNYCCWMPYMQEEEIQVFNYICNTQGVDAAYEYLERIASEIDNRWLIDQQQKDAAWAKEHPILASIASIVVTPFEGMNAAFHSLGSVLTGTEIRRIEVYSMGDTFRQAVSQDIYEKHGEVLGFIYDTGMSMADSVVLIGATFATGGLAGTSTITVAATNLVLSGTLMGSRAYVSTLNDALDRGLSDGQAVGLAFSSATVETLMEAYSAGHLLNLEGTLGNASTNIVTRVTANISNPTLQKIAINSGYFALGAISQGICEGEEEFCTEILNHYLDEMISGELSNYNLSIYNHMLAGMSEEEARRLATEEYHDQIQKAFLGGFVSGCCFGSVQIGVQEYNYTRNISQAINTEYRVNGLTEIEQTLRNQIMASVLGIDNRYQTICIDALAGNLTQEQVATMGIGGLFALNEAVNNYQRYDSTMTLENIFKNVNNIDIENSVNNANNANNANDYQAPSIKDVFNKIIGKDRTNSKFSFMKFINLNSKYQAILSDFINQFKQMPAYQNLSLSETVATRLIDQGMSIPDQKNIGKQFTRAAYFYLMDNGMSAQDAANFVSSYAETALRNSINFNIVHTQYGFNINFSSNIDANTQANLLNQFEKNFAQLPEVLKQQIKEVNFFDTYNPHDVYWEFTYAISNFQSGATGGNGVINLWTGRPDASLLAHEAAHSYDTASVASWGVIGNRISESQIWRNAMQLDLQLNGKTGVTDYAINSNSCVEDFAEAVSLFFTNPHALDAFPNRQSILSNFFYGENINNLSLDISIISDIINQNYGHQFKNVLTEYYLYGAQVDSKLEEFLSRYSVQEMYSVVGFDTLLGQVRTYNFTDYQQSISKALDNLINQYGIDQSIKIMEEYLATGNITLLPTENGIRFNITKFGIDGVRKYVAQISNGNFSANVLFSRYYLRNEISQMKAFVQSRYGDTSLEHIVYEYFIHGAQVDSELESILKKYSQADFLDVLNMEELLDTATMYTIKNYTESFEIAMNTLIENYGVAVASQVFEQYLETGNEYLLTCDNNVRFDIHKFGIENLKSYIQGMYNSTNLFDIFYQYQISQDITNFKNRVSKYYGSVPIEQLLYEYYIHGATIDSDIISYISKYTREEIATVLGINNLTEDFTTYTESDYQNALENALSNLIDQFGFDDAILHFQNFLDSGDVSMLTRDNNIRFDISKFGVENFRNYLRNINNGSSKLLFYVLKNMDLSNIDINNIDLSSLTDSEIKEILEPYTTKIQDQDYSSYKSFSMADELSQFFGTLSTSLKGKISSNLSFESPKTFLELLSTLPLNEQAELQFYLQNTRGGRWLATLTSEELKAIFVYTQNYYRIINGELRESNVSDWTESMARNIDSALAKFTLDEDIILWRGADFNAFSHLNISDYAGLQALVGQEYSDLGFMSTSVLSTNCFKWKNIFFKIYAPAGTNGAYINQISDLCNSEYEFLLARGTVLTIDSVSKVNLNGEIKIVIEARVTDNIAQELSSVRETQVDVNNTVTVNPELLALSEYDKALLFDFTLTGQEDIKSPGTIVDVFDETGITCPMIPLNVLNAIALDSTILTQVLNQQVDIANFNKADLKNGVESYITTSLKLMEQNEIYDYALIDAILAAELPDNIKSEIGPQFMDNLIEKGIENNSNEVYNTILTYLSTLDKNSRYYYLIEITGLEIESDTKTGLLEMLFSNKMVRECVYENAYQELSQSMYDTFGITDENVIREMLHSLIGTQDAFENVGIANSELNWQHFVEILSPYIKNKLAVYDPNKPPVLWSKVDCSKLNEKYTTIENSTIGTSLYFLDLVFSNWNSELSTLPRLENLWNLLSEEFANDLCQMKIQESSTQTIDNLRFIFPGMENFDGPFGDIFKNVEFAQILKNTNIKTLTLEAVLPNDVFTTSVPSVTINLDYFRQVFANNNTSYAMEATFEEFKGIVAAEFLNQNYDYFDQIDGITALMNNVTNNGPIAFTAFKNHLTQEIFNELFLGGF